MPAKKATLSGNAKIRMSPSLLSNRSFNFYVLGTVCPTGKQLGKLYYNITVLLELDLGTLCVFGYTMKYEER